MGEMQSSAGRSKPKALRIERQLAVHRSPDVLGHAEPVLLSLEEDCRMCYAIGGQRGSGVGHEP